MPTYEYRCESEDKVFEYFQSMKDDALTECPTCKGKVTRLISRNVGIMFKGSGFYINDAQNSTSGKTSDVSNSAAPSKSN